MFKISFVIIILFYFSNLKFKNIILYMANIKNFGEKNERKI